MAITRLNLKAADDTLKGWTRDTYLPTFCQRQTRWYCLKLRRNQSDVMCRQDWGLGAPQYPVSKLTFGFYWWWGWMGGERRKLYNIGKGRSIRKTLEARHTFPSVTVMTFSHQDLFVFFSFRPKNNQIIYLMNVGL